MTSTPKVPAADQVLRVLRLLGTARGPLPASVIAERLALPRSTVYHLLATLQEHGFALHLPEERRYGIGVAAFELSSSYLRQEPLARVARPVLASLVDRVGLSGHFAAPHGRDVLYLIEERAKGAPALVTDVDVRLPMHLTATGRAILAALPKSQVRVLYPDRGAFVHAEPPTGVETDADDAGVAAQPREDPIESYRALRAVLDETAARGFALEQGSVTPGLSSVSVPVLDHRGLPVAAIALTFRDGQAGEARFTALADQVREAAAKVSSRIYGVAAAR
ncbi:MAG: IclR family transcriptional regulator [Microbacterium sp.]